MRIYSNILLSWPQTIHVFQAARLYPGQWRNYNIYKINCVQPLVLTSYSPMELLQENCQYYCYNKYYRNKRLEKYGNTCELVSDANQQIWVHIPKVVEANDIIVMRNDTANGFHISSLFKNPGLA